MKITFVPGSKIAELVVPMPKPAVNYMPKWYKDMPSTDENGKSTAKRCTPFMDSFITGYIQELWCDLKIERKNGVVIYSHGGDIKPMESRFEYAGTRNLIPHFQGYQHLDFHWITQWEPKTPRGYSTIYSHPYNQFDLPFLTMNGIIDTDKFSMSGPLPFLLKDDFEGIIPEGTPIYQINFIKRNNYISEGSIFDENQYIKMRHKVKKHITGGYKKHFWNKKSFR